MNNRLLTTDKIWGCNLSLSLDRSEKLSASLSGTSFMAVSCNPVFNPKNKQTPKKSHSLIIKGCYVYGTVARATTNIDPSLGYYL